MKTALLALSLLTITGTALADTTNLAPEACSTFCFGPVANSAGWAINYVDYAFQYRRLTIYVNGEQYEDAIYSEVPVITHPQPNVSLYTINTTLFDPVGDRITVSNLRFTQTTTCHYKCIVVTQMLGGELTQ